MPTRIILSAVPIWFQRNNSLRARSSQPREQHSEDLLRLTAEDRHKKPSDGITGMTRAFQVPETDAVVQVLRLVIKVWQDVSLTVFLSPRNPAIFPSFRSAFTWSLTCSIILSLGRLVCRNFCLGAAGSSPPRSRDQVYPAFSIADARPRGDGPRARIFSTKSVTT